MNTLSNSNWTFGIITENITLTESGDICKEQNQILYSAIQSILDLNISSNKYELIIIGGNNLKKDIQKDNITILYFDENIKRAWITKKKNIIFDRAQFENTIIIHDYVSFDKNWYNGFLSFETDWDVCMCQIRNKDNIRWRDWLLWWCGTAPYRLEHNGKRLPANRLLYDDYQFVNNDMYINGTVIIGKTNYLKNNKFDENRCWGQGEDCEWSARCRPTWKYKMNVNSTLRLLKQKED
jgi:hypothetical protein